MTAPAVLELAGVHFAYPDGSPGLRDCSLALGRGRRHALLGANGAGKSTVLRHLNGLLRPAAGVLRHHGQVVGHGRAALNALRRGVGLVFQDQDRQLFAAHVGEDVSFGPLNLGLDAATVRVRVAAALEAVGLSGHAGRAVHHLSFGQKKRVCIAGVLAMEPQVLLLDEPMAGLDAPMQAALAVLLDRLAARGITVMLSTHDADFAFGWADDVHLMAAGRCIASGPAMQLAERADLLRQAGHDVPQAVALHRELVALGVLGADPPPRSVPALLAALRALRAAPAPEHFAHPAHFAQPGRTLA